MTEVLELHERLSPAAAKTRSIEMLAKVGIPDAARRFNQYPHQFSGGMRQRVMIAMALQCRPEVLLADEPTTALDVTIQAQILDLLRNLASELGTSMVLVTHDLGVVAGMANDILVMYAGRVVESASTEALFARPQHPYTIGLLRSLPGRRVIAEAAVGARASERHVTSGATAGVVSPALRRLASIPGRPPDPTALPPGCPFVPRCPWAFDRCTAERPPLRPTPAGNLSACWLDDPETLPQTRPGLWEMSA
jgi:ABC-type dipeptide/oligopeptide/nickel transport system ATPase component